MIATIEIEALGIDLTYIAISDIVIADCNEGYAG